MLDVAIIIVFISVFINRSLIVSNNIMSPKTYGNSIIVCPIAIFRPFLRPPHNPIKIAVVVSGPGLNAPLNDITITDIMASIIIEISI